MNLSITQKNEQVLFSRLEIKATLDSFSKTPSNQEVQKLIADTLKTPQEHVVVKRILGMFGKRSADVVAYIYNDVAAKERAELRFGKKALEKQQKSSGQQPQKEPQTEQAKPKEAEKK